MEISILDNGSCILSYFDVPKKKNVLLESYWISYISVNISHTLDIWVGWWDKYRWAGPFGAHFASNAFCFQCICPQFILLGFFLKSGALWENCVLAPLCPQIQPGPCAVNLIFGLHINPSSVAVEMFLKCTADDQHSWKCLNLHDLS